MVPRHDGQPAWRWPSWPRRCVEKFGDFKKAESVIGTGPWMLDSYRPNVGLTYVRNPSYFIAGLPYIDRVEVTVDEDNASRIAAFLSGKYDLGWEFPGTINRTDWVQIKDKLKQKRPKLQTVEFPSNVMSHISMRTDQKPFSDVRVRQAMSLAIDRKGIIEATSEGVGAMNPPVPAGLKEWSIPIDKLGEGAKYYKHDPAEAKQLLAAAGYPNGFPVTMCFTTYGSTVLVDVMQLVQKDLKDVGIDAKIDQKEYGAYIATCFYGKFDSHDLRAADAVPRARQLPLRPVLPRASSRTRATSTTRWWPTCSSASGGRSTSPSGARSSSRSSATWPSSSTTSRCRPACTSRCGKARCKNYGPNIGYDYGGRLHGRLARPLGLTGPGSGEFRAQAVRRQAAADRDPVAADRVADRLHAAASHPRRRRPAHAGREGVRQGHRGAAGQAWAGPADLRAVLRVGGPRRPR